MHEMGIALEVINIALASIPEQMTQARVARVNLQVGKLAAIVPDSLRFCFDIASKGTRLENAELVIETIPIRARCGDCDHNWTVDQPVFRCPDCQSGAIEILSGRELDIRSIEINDEA